MEDAAHPWREAGLVRALAEAGQFDEATERLDQLLAHREELLAGFLRRYSLVMLAESAEILGHVEAAEQLLQWLTGELDSGECVIIGPNAFYGSVRRYMGLAALTIGQTDDAVEHLQAALTIHGRMRAKGWEARTRYDIARTLLVRGDPGDDERAAALVDEARLAAGQLGMPRLLEEIVALGVPPVLL